MAVSQTTAPTTRVTANSSHWGISKSNHNHRTPVECPFWTINSAAATAASAPTSRPHRNGRRFSIERRSSANVWSRSVGSPISCHRLWSRCLLGFSAFAHRIAQCPARDGFARCSSQPRTERGAGRSGSIQSRLMIAAAHRTEDGRVALTLGRDLPTSEDPRPEEPSFADANRGNAPRTSTIHTGSPPEAHLRGTASNAGSGGNAEGPNPSCAIPTLRAAPRTYECAGRPPRGVPATPGARCHFANAETERMERCAFD